MGDHGRGDDPFVLFLVPLRGTERISRLLGPVIVCWWTQVRSAGMWLGVLGPVECAVDGTAVEVPGRLNRALLAALAVDRERVTGIDELVDALWRDAAAGRRPRRWSATGSRCCAGC